MHIIQITMFYIIPVISLYFIQIPSIINSYFYSLLDDVSFRFYL